MAEPQKYTDPMERVLLTLDSDTSGREDWITHISFKPLTPGWIREFTISHRQGYETKISLGVKKYLFGLVKERLKSAKIVAHGRDNWFITRTASQSKKFARFLLPFLAFDDPKHLEILKEFSDSWNEEEYNKESGKPVFMNKNCDWDTEVIHYDSSLRRKACFECLDKSFYIKTIDFLYYDDDRMVINSIVRNQYKFQAVDVLKALNIAVKIEGGPKPEIRVESIEHVKSMAKYLSETIMFEEKKHDTILHQFENYEPIKATKIHEVKRSRGYVASPPPISPSLSFPQRPFPGQEPGYAIDNIVLELMKQKLFTDILESMGDIKLDPKPASKPDSDSEPDLDSDSDSMEEVD